MSMHSSNRRRRSLDCANQMGLRPCAPLVAPAALSAERTAAAAVGGNILITGVIADACFYTTYELPACVTAPGLGQSHDRRSDRPQTRSSPPLDESAVQKYAKVSNKSLKKGFVCVQSSKGVAGGLLYQGRTGLPRNCTAGTRVRVAPGGATQTPRVPPVLDRTCLNKQALLQ